MKRLLIPIAVAVALVGSERADADPVLLMFPPGGFIFECPAECMRPQQQLAEQIGFQARVVPYTLWNVPRAMKDARASVPAHRRVFAYGESAGGLFAARLAQKGLVEAAALQSPVANLPKWISTFDDPGFVSALLKVPTLEERRRYSPHRYRSREPIFAIAAAIDPQLTAATRAWAAKRRRVWAKAEAGEHLELSRAERLLVWLRRFSRR